MKNNALKNYPKEYDNSYIAESVKNMFEEQDKSVLERKNVIDVVDAELDEDLNDDVVEDFDATDKPKAEEKMSVEEDEGLPF